MIFIGDIKAINNEIELAKFNIKHFKDLLNKSDEEILKGTPPEITNVEKAKQDITRLMFYWENVLNKAKQELKELKGE